MSKRLERELKDARRQFQVEGNRGGSFVLLQRTGREDEVWVEVGHECVIRLARRIPVTAFAELLGKMEDAGQFAAFPKAAE